MLSGMRIDSSCNSGLAGITTDANHILPSQVFLMHHRRTTYAGKVGSLQQLIRAAVSTILHQ